MKMVCKAIGLALLLGGAAAHADTPGWSIAERSGKVQLLQGGASKAAAKGSAIAAGDVIATDYDGRLVLERGREQIILSPNSRVRLIAPQDAGGPVQFFQERGKAQFRTARKADVPLAVQTPYLAALFQDTTFSMDVTPLGASIQVTHGSVQLSTIDGGATALVKPGMIGVVAHNQRTRLVISGSEHRVIESPKVTASNAAMRDSSSVTLSSAQGGQTQIAARSTTPLN